MKVLRFIRHSAIWSESQMFQLWVSFALNWDELRKYSILIPVTAPCIFAWAVNVSNPFCGHLDLLTRVYNLSVEVPNLRSLGTIFWVLGKDAPHTFGVHAGEASPAQGAINMIQRQFLLFSHRLQQSRMFVVSILLYGRWGREMSWFKDGFAWQLNSYLRSYLHYSFFSLLTSLIYPSPLGYLLAVNVLRWAQLYGQFPK